MDDVTRPEDLQKGRTEGAQPDQVEHPDFQKRERGGPDTSQAEPVEQPRRRGRGTTAGRRPAPRRRADREPSAGGGEQEAGEEAAPR